MEFGARLERCITRWSLELDSHEIRDSSLVAIGRRADGSPVILKLIVDERAYRSEAAALRLFRDRGAVTLLDQSQKDAALLLQRVEPGSPLWDLVDSRSDEQATRIAGGMIARLQTPPNEVDADLVDAVAEAFAALDWYLTGDHGMAGAIPDQAVRRAKAQLTELQAGAHRQVALHGDLHHENILRSGSDAWVVIDPKGKVGPPGYECAALMRNPMGYLSKATDLPAVLSRRAEQLAEITGTDLQELRLWADAMAVVAACWQLENGEPGWEQWQLISEGLAQGPSNNYRDIGLENRDG